MRLRGEKRDKEQEKVKELLWKYSRVDTGEEEEVDEGAERNVGEEG